MLKNNQKLGTIEGNGVSKEKMTSSAITARLGQGQCEDTDNDNKLRKMIDKRKRQNDKRSSLSSFSLLSPSSPTPASASSSSSSSSSHSSRRRVRLIDGAGVYSSTTVVVVTFAYYLLAFVCVSNSLVGVCGQAPTLDTTFLYNIPSGSGSESQCYDDRGNAQR